jgi:HEAT repeat protein
MAAMLWWTLHQLKSSDPKSKIKAARALGSAKERKAVPVLIELLKDENSDLRSAAIEALGAIGHPGSAEGLISALSSPHPSAKGTAEHEALARALAGLGGAAVRPLIQALASENRQTRRWSACALGMIKDPQAVDPLIEKLDDSRSEVRKAAALALGEIGDLRAIKGLVRALANRDPDTRRAAAEALGCLPSEDGIPALARAVADSSEPVQVAAVHALAKIGGLAAAACLRSAVSGMRKAAHDAAQAALGTMSFSPANAEERAEAAVIRGDFRAALREGPAAVPALVGALSFKDPQWRAHAAEALADFRSPDLVQLFLECLKDHDAAVQESAARALAGIGEAARRGLQETLSFYDASAVRLAAIALGEIGDSRSVPALGNLISENSSISGEYPDLFEAVSAAAESLRKILSLEPEKIPEPDLERITSLPKEVRLLGSSPKQLDCSHLQNLAREEVRRRQSLPPTK